MGEILNCQNPRNFRYYQFFRSPFCGRRTKTRRDPRNTTDNINIYLKAVHTVHLEPKVVLILDLLKTWTSQNAKLKLMAKSVRDHTERYYILSIRITTANLHESSRSCNHILRPALSTLVFPATPRVGVLTNINSLEIYPSVQ